MQQASLFHSAAPRPPPLVVAYGMGVDSTAMLVGLRQRGIRPDLIKRPIESWSELLNPEFKGKASILDIPSIGIMDAAMVNEALGKVKYADKGNMTKKEIDALDMTDAWDRPDDERIAVVALIVILLSGGLDIGVLGAVEIDAEGFVDIKFACPVDQNHR